MWDLASRGFTDVFVRVLRGKSVVTLSGHLKYGLALRMVSGVWSSKINGVVESLVEEIIVNPLGSSGTVVNVAWMRVGCPRAKRRNTGLHHKPFTVGIQIARIVRKK